MNVRHEVSVQRGGDPEGPDSISQRLPDPQVKDPVERRTAAARLPAAHGFGQEGFVSEARQHQDEHEDGQNSQRVVESRSLQQTGQNVRERDGEHAAARRHDAVHKAQPALEVMTQNHQTGLIRETAAAREHYTICEVQRPERPAERNTQIIIL